MTRGMWRWRGHKDDADAWWARVEARPGEWNDVDVAQYEKIACEPPFWDLPVKEEYFATLRTIPERRIEVMSPALFGMIVVAGVLFFALVIPMIVLAHFNS